MTMVEIFEVNCFDSDIHGEAQVLIELVLFPHVCAPFVRHPAQS